jgi:hypothetical protein
MLIFIVLICGGLLVGLIQGFFEFMSDVWPKRRR